MNEKLHEENMALMQYEGHPIKNETFSIAH